MTTGISGENILFFALGGALVYVGMSWMKRKVPSGVISKLSQFFHTPPATPTPLWRPGQNQPMPSHSKKWRTYTPSDLKAPGSLYHLVISSIVPRPIALVTSQDKQGVLNCAPFSYFNVLSHDPPIVAIGCCMNMRAKTKKDTLANIEATGASATEQ
ncbi:hypothetical protein EON65_44045 [archaeon]|nr:MAG: hypothetical protein EON65_44045 [archaeon]